MFDNVYEHQVKQGHEFGNLPGDDDNDDCHDDDDYVGSCHDDDDHLGSLYAVMRNASGKRFSFSETFPEEYDGNYVMTIDSNDDAGNVGDDKGDDHYHHGLDDSDLHHGLNE